MAVFSVFETEARLITKCILAKFLVRWLSGLPGLFLRPRRLRNHAKSTANFLRPTLPTLRLYSCRRWHMLYALTMLSGYCTFNAAHAHANAVYLYAYWSPFCQHSVFMPHDCDYVSCMLLSVVSITACGFRTLTRKYLRYNIVCSDEFYCVMNNKFYSMYWRYKNLGAFLASAEGTKNNTRTVPINSKRIVRYNNDKLYRPWLISYHLRQTSSFTAFWLFCQKNFHRTLESFI